MAGPIYCVSNLLDSASLITASPGTASTSSTDNLHNARSSKPWFSSGVAGTQTLTLDMVATRAPTFAALINHNLPSGTTIQIRSSSDNFAADDTLVASFTYRATNAWVNWSTPTARRYWRLRLVGTFASAPKIGEWMLGTETQVSRAFSWSPVFGRTWRNISHETQGGQRWTYEINERRDYALAWRGLTEAQKDELGTLLEATKGDLTPLVLVPFPGHATKSGEVYHVFGPPRLEYVDVHAANKQVGALTFVELPREMAA